MSFRWLSGSLATLACAAVVSVTTSYGAFAQAAPAANPDTKWIKICQTDPKSKKELCIVSQEIRAETGQFIAAATLRQVTGSDKISLVAAVPLGMLIKAGIQARIDQQDPKKIDYGICLTNACFGELDVDKAFIDSLKKGGDLVISVLGQGGGQQPKPISFTLSLKGFTKTWDGPGLDPQAGQQAQNKLDEILKQRAEEQRQKLIDLQKNSGK